MLELPEVINLSQQLNQTVQGKTITKVVAAHSPHRFTFYFGDPQTYPDRLLGQKWGRTEPMGIFVEVHLSNQILLFNDGVNVRYLPDLDQAPSKHQLLLGFDDDSGLVFTTQMYGGIMVFEPGEFDNKYYTASRSKISPLSDQFDENYFNQLFTAVPNKLSLKAFLATEQRIPGLGNGVLQDILYNARLNPQTKLSQLSLSDRQQLFQSLKATLQTMTAAGGRNTEKDLFGQPGGYQTLLSSKTIAEPCPNCGDWIVKKSFLGGSIYFCPTCQPLPLSSHS